MPSRTPPKRKSRRLAICIECNEMVVPRTASMCGREDCPYSTKPTKAQATASPYDCGANPTKDYPGE